VTHGRGDDGATGFGRDVFARSGRLNVAPEEGGKAANQQQELITRKHWEGVYHQTCRVTHFNPLPSTRVEGGKVVSKNSAMPYAIVTLECPTHPPDLRGLIAHKVDFRNLWEAFAERGNRDDREVIIFWVKKPRNLFARMVAPFLPGLHVMLCKAGAYELMTDPDRCPELRGAARFRAEAPLMEWKPDAAGARLGPFFFDGAENGGPKRHSKAAPAQRRPLSFCSTRPEEDWRERVYTNQV